MLALMRFSSPFLSSRQGRTGLTLLVLACTLAPNAWAQSATQRYPVTPNQRAMANSAAEQGVALADLQPNAPDQYVVKRGDSLWAISSIFLRSPWRWPQLWGQNMESISNPHLIYPGQTLYLNKANGRATLGLKKLGSGDSSDMGSDNGFVKLSPRIRTELEGDSAIPTIAAHLIESFLAEPLIVDEATFKMAPRIVSTQEERVLLSKGDRAYARGTFEVTKVGEPYLGSPLVLSKANNYRVFRNATPLKDPITKDLLGYEIQYVGKAELMRSESLTPGAENTKSWFSSKPSWIVTPATIDIRIAKEEMRVGDRLVPEPPRELPIYMPRAPNGAINARVVSLYGNAVTMGTQNQVVAINVGTAHGMQIGHVLAIQKEGPVATDKTDDSRTSIKLPNERNGLLMVFRPFERVSYALILSATDGVRVGDQLINPK